ncbi:MAG TPA: hypothetical protein VHL31_22660 [Geminicoccus sp.]|jgi:hypothetical protein|uniref:hypothetical protein n=1 Tax=Geminicoccus sp. TaxID=2024832 RepID=UPI002E32F7B7|nr:hypothetical protein [Geminicoccus sp.]HEX2529083.1 hypothetical protein [Geminicoccus sp.]
MQRRDFLAGLVATPTMPTLTELMADVKLASHQVPAPTPTVPSKKNFQAWECMRWNNAPASLATCGLRRMPIYYQNSLVTGTELDFPKLDKVIANIKANRQSFVTLDIEWNAASTSDRQKMIRLVAYMRSKLPTTTKLAIFGRMPKPRYADYVAGGERLARMRRENRLMIPLAEKVDWIMPQFYTYNTNRKDWVKFAEIMISEARIYNKPVMPWVWPQYNDWSADKSLRYQFISGDFFRLQLDTTYRLADSLCIWGTLKPLPNGTRGRATWNPNAPWWLQTKAFLKSHGQLPATCRA